MQLDTAWSVCNKNRLNLTHEFFVITLDVNDETAVRVYTYDKDAMNEDDVHIHSSIVWCAIYYHSDALSVRQNLTKCKVKAAWNIEFVLQT